MASMSTTMMLVHEGADIGEREAKPARADATATPRAPKRSGPCGLDRRLPFASDGEAPHEIAPVIAESPTSPMRP